MKEILDRLEKIGYYASVPKELAYMTTNITPQECKQILDYITNLQQENESNINRIHELEQEIDSEYIQKEYYKSRCEKAAGILGNYKHLSSPTEEQAIEQEDIVDNAYDILNGRSDE